MFSKTITSASIIGLAASVSAQLGSAIIKNQCSGNAYIWTVSDYASNMVTVAPGSSYSNAYQSNSDGGGISIKIATEPDMSGPITQFEYTLGSGAWADLWYDISNINGYPFIDSGLSLIPSDSSCRSVICPAGVVCTLAYNQPDDNEATASCSTSSDMTLILCANGADKTNPSSAAPAPTSTTVKAAQVVSTTASSIVSTTPAPAPTTYNAPPSPVSGLVATTFVTEVFTVWIDPSGIPAVGKRNDEEERMHKRLAHRHHFNRHVEESN